MSDLYRVIIGNSLRVVKVRSIQPVSDLHRLDRDLIWSVNIKSLDMMTPRSLTLFRDGMISPFGEVKLMCFNSAF